MTQPNEPTPTETGQSGQSTFTQVDVDRIVSERLNRERSRYADYDQIKERAGQFDQLSGTLDNIKEALGLKEEVDPAQLSQQLSQQQSLAADAALELDVYKRASNMGVKAGKLLDSMSFRKAVDELPDEDFEERLDELISQWADKDPSLRGSGPPAAAGRAPLEALRPGTLPSPPEPTLADQIAAAEKASNWALARQLKAQQLMKLHEKNV